MIALTAIRLAAVAALVCSAAHRAGPKVRCTLDVVGTGLNAERNPTFTCTSECAFRGESHDGR